jgi:hypothetical protein
LFKAIRIRELVILQILPHRNFNNAWNWKSNVVSLTERGSSLLTTLNDAAGLCGHFKALYNNSAVQLHWQY